MSNPVFQAIAFWVLYVGVIVAIFIMRGQVIMFKLLKRLFRWFETDKLPNYNPFPFTLTIAPSPGEKGYTVTCKELPELLTCGDTVDEALEMAKDAYRVVMELYLLDGIGKDLPNNAKGS